METINQNNQEEQANNTGGLNENEQNEAGAYNDPGDDAADQEDYPATGVDDTEETGEDNGAENDDLAEDDDDDLTESDDVDESANDADGNGGYSDAANPAETNSWSLQHKQTRLSLRVCLVPPINPLHFYYGYQQSKTDPRT